MVVRQGVGAAAARWITLSRGSLCSQSVAVIPAGCTGRPRSFRAQCAPCGLARNRGQRGASVRGGGSLWMAGCVYHLGQARGHPLSIQARLQVQPVQMRKLGSGWDRAKGRGSSPSPFAVRQNLRQEVAQPSRRIFAGKHPPQIPLNGNGATAAAAGRFADMQRTIPKLRIWTVRT